MADRVPSSAANFPQPPPATNRGSNPDGSGAPRRDRRRTRAMGCDLVAAVGSAAFTGHQSSIGTIDGQLCAYDPPGDMDGDVDSRTLMAFLKCYAFWENAVTGLAPGAIDPFAGVASSVVGDLILQSLQVLVNLQWGADGVSKNVILSLSPGQIVKAGLAGMYARANAKLSAKYYARQRGADVGVTQQFFYFDPDPNARNNIWNNINSPALVAAAGYDVGTVPTTPIHLDGILALGDAVVPQGGSFDRSSRPVRRFFGTFPPEGAGYPAGGAFVHCPVAAGAGAVMLQTLGAAFTVPAGALRAPLKFAMLDSDGFLLGEQPANTFVPLIDGCVEVVVYASVANAAENPFAILYDLGL